MTTIAAEQRMYYALRIACAMCFIGHGAFGIITKPVWCHYFAIVGIGRDMAYELMPLVGAVDIIMGIILLIYPIRVVALWLVIWGVVTAAMRPLAGEPFAEMLERAGNYGAPLALLLLSPAYQGKSYWLDLITVPAVLPVRRAQNVQRCLRIAGFVLMAGHSWLNLIGKQGLIIQYTSLGFQDPQQIALAAGIIELLAALIILLKPVRSMVFLVILWKMATELFYPHHQIFEWVERGGSYGVLFALWDVMKPLKKQYEIN